MAEILAGAATPAQIAGFIVALRMKGETVDELRGPGRGHARRRRAGRASTDGPPAVDIVGTGGDRAHTINVSTLAALVVAGRRRAGVQARQPGGVVVDRCRRPARGARRAHRLRTRRGGRPASTEAGIGFCFAPRFHPAMRHAGPTRRELGVPTVFNFLGPLANPAGVRRLMIGVADPSMAERMVGVLAARGAERALVVHGDDGLDELTISTTSQVVELRDGEITTYEVDPAALGPRARRRREALRGGDPATNADLARPGARRRAGPPPRRRRASTPPPAWWRPGWSTTSRRASTPPGPRSTAAAAARRSTAWSASRRRRDSSHRVHASATNGGA